jgi:hypothetical protein
MSEKFPIDNDIPFPEGRTSRHPLVYPFDELQVGQSFFVASREPYFTGEVALCSAYHRARRELGYNFAWAKVEGGYRIYRLPGVATSRRHKETVRA